MSEDKNFSIFSDLTPAAEIFVKHSVSLSIIQILNRHWKENRSIVKTIPQTNYYRLVFLVCSLVPYAGLVLFLHSALGVCWLVLLRLGET